jgi:hypothetical protein
MKYVDGETIRVGDKLKVWKGCIGVVVASMDTREYSAEHPEEQWGYLRVGIMIDTDQAGLVHITETDPDLELIERVSCK